MNFMKTYQSQDNGFSGGSTPAQFDINGYPIATLPGNVGASVLMPAGFAGNGTVWVLKWPATRPITFVFNTRINVTNCFTTPTCTVLLSNGQTFAGSGASCTTPDTLLGPSCRIEFNFDSYSSNAFSFFFPSGANNYAAGSGQLVLVRKNDEAAFNAGAVFTPEFLANLGGLNPKTIRTMGWSNTNSSNEVNWNYRTTPNSLSYLNSVYPPNIWAGGPGSAGAINCPGTSATCTSDTYTASAATDTPGTWTDGEVIQGVVNFSNATTTPTLNVAGRGAKTILADSSLALSIGQIPAGSRATFIYNALLGKVLWFQFGVTPTTPIEVRAALANAVHAHLWSNVPFLANNTYITNEATAAFSNLKANLNFYEELSNELWNGGFDQDHISFSLGQALGWGIPNNQAQLSYQGLRTIQMASLATAAWTGAPSRLKIITAFQAAAFGISSVNTNLFQGNALNGASFPTYCAFVGGSFSGGVCTGDPNYFQAPNRPIDKTQIVSYAPYFEGAAFGHQCDSGVVIENCGISSYLSLSAYNIALLQTMATDYAAGGSGITTAKNLLDGDIRHGQLNSQTVTLSSSTFTIAGTNTFINGNSVLFASTGSLPSGVTANVPYFVVNNVPGGTNTGTFQVASTLGGSPLTITGGSGTLSVGAFGGAGNITTETQLDYVANIYGSTNGALAGWQTVVSTNSYNVVVEAYEGGLEALNPSISDCTAMGITAPPLGGGGPTAAGCSAQLGALLTDYKNDVNFGKAIALSDFNQFVGKDASQINFGLVTSARAPSWLTLTGLTQWSLLSGDVFSTPFQTYNGFAAFTYP